jgi:hypothetical protein
MNNMTSYLSNPQTIPAVWVLNETYQSYQIANLFNNQFTGAIIDGQGNQVACTFSQNLDTSWTLNGSSEKFYLPANIVGLYINRNANGEYIGYYQVVAPGAWKNINFTLIPFTGILENLTNRVYTKGTRDMKVWSGPITNKFSVCGNDSSQYNLTNQVLRDYARNNPGTGFIDASFNPSITTSQLDTKSWMTKLWLTIKNMPAREFLFLGCHDALATYGGPGEGYGATAATSRLATGYSVDQDRRITAMLNDGCRFLDLRFQEQDGYHSSIFFNVTQTQVVQELADFLSISGNNEIIVISLLIKPAPPRGSLGITVAPTNSTFTSLYQGFKNLLGLHSSIRPIAFDSTTANPASTLEQLSRLGNVIFLVNDNVFTTQTSYFPPSVSTKANPSWTPPSDIFWLKKSEDAAKYSGSIYNAMDYYNDIIEKGYISDELSGNLFNYLSLTSSGEKSGSSNNDLAQEMNGPMADWLLNATELNNSMLSINDSSISVSSAAKTILSSYGFQKVTLPFKTTSNGGTKVKNRNFNLVGVNFYEKGPFIINAIAQNIISAMVGTVILPSSIEGKTFTYQYGSRAFSLTFSANNILTSDLPWNGTTTWKVIEPNQVELTNAGKKNILTFNSATTYSGIDWDGVTKIYGIQK